MRVHYIDPYLLNPPHKVTVDLIGLGGTGSQMLTALARINESLVATGHPGLHVRSWDSDIVTQANIGRQLFSPADLGINKAVVLTGRVNRYFGYEWEAVPTLYKSSEASNLTISCIDTAIGRVMLGMKIEGHKRKGAAAVDRRIYWLDMGNLQKTGQVVLGTINPIKQPKTSEKTAAVLKTVTKKFPQLKRIKEVDQGPSCSLADALNKQDLFINSTIAQFGANMIWKLFRDGKLRYHGCYLNLESLIVNPIKIS